MSVGLKYPSLKQPVQHIEFAYAVEVVRRVFVQAISVKDLHSCRHTFCYYAGLAGIPLAIVQAIVGHMSPEMTKHYQAHATLEDKRRGMERLSFFTQDALPAAVEEPERAELRSWIGSLPIELIREMLSLCKSGGRKKRFFCSKWKKLFS